MSFPFLLPTSRSARTVFHMSEEEIIEVERRMRPGQYSGEGFLKEGERLVEVCTRDLMLLWEEKVSCDLIANVLDGIIQAAKRSENEKPIVGGKFKVQGARIAMNGYQKCPFHKPSLEICHLGRQDFTITNIKNSKSIRVASLVIDMIRDHGFFESGPYRLDPKEAIECLELQTAEYEMITECTGEMCYLLDEEELGIEEEAAKKNASKSFLMGPCLRAYILPYKDRDKFENHGLTLEQKIRKEAISQGKTTEEEIQKHVDSCVSFHQIIYKSKCNKSSLDSKAILSTVIKRSEEEGEEFLHIFNDSPLDKNPLTEFEGIKLSSPIKHKGAYIFKLKTHTYANISKDTLSATREPELKRRRLK